MKLTIPLPKMATIGLALFVLLGCTSVKSEGPPAAWRAINGGMTRQEISQLIGPPAHASGQGGDVWVKAGWEMHIDYDQYGRARNILSQPTGK